MNQLAKIVKPEYARPTGSTCVHRSLYKPIGEVPVPEPCRVCAEIARMLTAGEVPF